MLAAFVDDDNILEYRMIVSRPQRQHLSRCNQVPKTIKKYGACLGAQLTICTQELGVPLRLALSNFVDYQ